MRQCWLFPALFILLLLICPFQASAEPGKGAEGTKKEYKVGDPELDVIWVDEQNGKYLPLDRTFQDETGNSVQLKDIIDKPTLLLLSISTVPIAAPSIFPT